MFWTYLESFMFSWKLYLLHHLLHFVSCLVGTSWTTSCSTSTPTWCVRWACMRRSWRLWSTCWEVEETLRCFPVFLIHILNTQSCFSWTRKRLCNWNWWIFFVYRKFDSRKWWPIAVASCATSAGSAVRTSAPCSTTSHTCCRTVALDWVGCFVKCTWHR